MGPTATDLGIVVLMAGMTYALMSEGLWGACLMFFNALFAGMIAFNFYEPLAQLVATNVSFAAVYADAVSMLLIFVVSLILLRVTTDSLAPSMVRFPPPLYHLGRVVFALGGAAVTVGILLLALEASPVQKKVLGYIDYKAEPPFKMGLDRRFLAFFQYSTGYTFSRFGSGYPDTEFRNTFVFDREGMWLLNHQQARPYGEGDILGGSGDATAPKEGESVPAESGGDPAANSGRPGPGIPGGTAGAAAGLAPLNP